ncbi:MAG TPA: 50S ribosomal protein L15, partial [Erysipelotrichaceae bacterium]|nr:50S ribosomal protein L15 [Erysipelotrichaceae bacterium]
GGQMPLYRRLPKRGFKNYNKKNIVTVDVTKLEKFENGAVVDIQALLDAGIIRDVYDGVKVIGNGELTKKLTVKVDAFSAGAKEKIESVGGTAEIAE